LGRTAWIRKLNALTSKHPWDIEVAAALYLSHADDHKRAALLKTLRTTEGRERLADLVPGPSPQRTLLEADLHIGLETSYTKQVAVQRASLTSTAAAKHILQSIDNTLFEPETDIELLQLFDGHQTDYLCAALATEFRKAPLQNFWNYSGRDQNPTGKSGLRNYHLKRLLQIIEADPFLEHVAEPILKNQWPKDFLPAIKVAGAKHPVSIEAANWVLQTLTFDTDMLEALQYMKPNLAPDGRDILLTHFRFEEPEAAKVLGLTTTP